MSVVAYVILAVLAVVLVAGFLGSRGEGEDE